MKLLNNAKEKLNENNFDLIFESHMVQSRIISSILEVIENKGYTQQDLESLTGLSQPFLSGLFNNKKKLNVEHIAKFQNALQIVLQPPKHLSIIEHANTYYREDDYAGIEKVSECISKEIQPNYILKMIECNLMFHSKHSYHPSSNIEPKKEKLYECA